MSERKRKETDRKAAFMQDVMGRPKRSRKPSALVDDADAESQPATSSARSDAELVALATSSARSDAELVALATQLTHVPRSDWPADVLEYHRRQRREEMRASRAALEQADQLRREVEQARREEQLGDSNGDNDDEDRHRREGARYARRTKRARDNAEYESTRIPDDLMSDEEIAAARVAPLAPLDEAAKQRIVERVRAALSDARQGERVCACATRSF